MLIKDRKLYYSAGELAGLFGIPKQTMFYYVKMGLLVPDYIADNGYRYFGDDQYLHMEIIYFLRKLDISVPDIKAYLRSNDLDKLRKLLAAKRKHCAAIIRHQQGLIKILEACEDRLASSRHLLLDQVLLKDYPEKYYIVSTYATASGPCYGNPRNDPEMLQPDIGPITTRAAHVSKLFANRDFKDRATGWIVLREKFFTATLPSPSRSWQRFFPKMGCTKPISSPLPARTWCCISRATTSTTPHAPAG